MKYLLFIVLLLSTSLQAQDDDEFFFNKKGDSLTGKPIKLPDPNWFEISTLVKVEYKRQYRYWYTLTINTDSVYKKLFRYSVQDSLPAIDFARSVLTLSYYCRQCAVYCKHSELDYGCHRNACRYTAVWRIKMNE